MDECNGIAPGYLIKSISPVLLFTSSGISMEVRSLILLQTFRCVGYVIGDIIYIRYMLIRLRDKKNRRWGISGGSPFISPVGAISVL